jgi:hypothetical protein
MWQELKVDTMKSYLNLKLANNKGQVLWEPYMVSEEF